MQKNILSLMTMMSLILNVVRCATNDESDSDNNQVEEAEREIPLNQIAPRFTISFRR